MLNLPINFFKSFTHDLISCHITRTTPKIDEFIWLGPKPPKSLWNRMHRLYSPVFKKNNTLCLLNYDLLKKNIPAIVHKENTFYLQKSYGPLQLITQNGKYEQLLLSHSKMESFPHEVYQIKISTAVGKDFFSKIQHGSDSSVGNIKNIRNNIHNMYMEIRQNGLTIKEIEINHTHPALELIILERRKVITLINGLSERDIQLTYYISQFLDCPISIKAITPNGISYSVRFQT